MSAMQSLRVLNLMGNPIRNKINFYRKILTLECKDLQYLDDRPIFPKDRVCAEAWREGGDVAEEIARKKWIEADQRKIHESVMALLSLKKRAKYQTQLNSIVNNSNENYDPSSRSQQKLEDEIAESSETEVGTNSITSSSEDDEQSSDDENECFSNVERIVMPWNTRIGKKSGKHVEKSCVIEEIAKEDELTENSICSNKIFVDEVSKDNIKIQPLIERVDAGENNVSQDNIEGQPVIEILDVFKNEVFQDNIKIQPVIEKLDVDENKISQDNDEIQPVIGILDVCKNEAFQDNIKIKPFIERLDVDENKISQYNIENQPAIEGEVTFKESSSDIVIGKSEGSQIEVSPERHCVSEREEPSNDFLEKYEVIERIREDELAPSPTESNTVIDFVEVRKFDDHAPDFVNGVYAGQKQIKQVKIVSDRHLNALLNAKDISNEVRVEYDTFRKTPMIEMISHSSTNLCENDRIERSIQCEKSFKNDNETILNFGKYEACFVEPEPQPLKEYQDIPEGSLSTTELKNLMMNQSYASRNSLCRLLNEEIQTQVQVDSTSYGTSQTSCGTIQNKSSDVDIAIDRMRGIKRELLVNIGGVDRSLLLLEAEFIDTLDQKPENPISKTDGVRNDTEERIESSSIQIGDECSDKRNLESTLPIESSQVLSTDTPSGIINMPLDCGSSLGEKKGINTESGLQGIKSKELEEILEHNYATKNAGILKTLDKSDVSSSGNNPFDENFSEKILSETHISSITFLPETSNDPHVAITHETSTVGVYSSDSSSHEKCNTTGCAIEADSKNFKCNDSIEKSKNYSLELQMAAEASRQMFNEN